jgi:Rhodopirellula transposase DDE domain
LKQVHAQAASDPETLRISLDTKAKVKIGEFSRGGMARGGEMVQAVDHDMHPDAVLAPAGILELAADQLNIVFGTSRDTSDFVADALELWWTNRREAYGQVRRLQIDLDNGPEIASSRTQFMKRLVEFSDRHQLTLELAYYPPYHSKYNPLERCWGILENHWNGTLLTSIDRVLSWAKTMTWRAVSPIVHLLAPRLRNGRPPHTTRIPTHRRPAQTIHTPAEMEPRDRTSKRVAYFKRTAYGKNLPLATEHAAGGF